MRRYIAILKKKYEQLAVLE